jgi:hypothetical protein
MKLLLVLLAVTSISAHAKNRYYRGETVNQYGQPTKDYVTQDSYYNNYNYQPPQQPSYPTNTYSGYQPYGGYKK